MSNNFQSIVKEETATYFINSKLSNAIRVKIEEDTVWLTQSQMVELFDSTKQNISLHIRNIYKEKELEMDSTVKEYLTVQKEGLRNISRKVKCYNLDVVISVGYRVKSIRGTQFRIWANKVLKDYLLKGYAIHQRLEQIEKQVWNQGQQLEQIIQTALPPKEGIFYDGQVFEAYQFVSNLIQNAKKSIILIDNYVDDSVLVLLSKSKKEVKLKIYTQKVSQQFQLDIAKFNAQYSNLEVEIFIKSHDRFLILDEQTVYHIGASLKDLGKKWFAFSKMNIDAKEIVEKVKGGSYNS